MKPDFSKTDFGKVKLTDKSAPTGSLFTTAENIPLKSIYTNVDQPELTKHFSAGMPPFLRGPYASMYTVRPWTIRQYAGFSTARESNAFYRRNLAAGQRGLSIAF